MPSSNAPKAAALVADLALGIMLLVAAYLLRPLTSGPRLLTETRGIDLASVEVGKALLLPGVDWRLRPRNVVLLIRPSCPYCNKSAGFYGRLSREVSRSPSTRLIVVTRQANKDRIVDWLDAKQIQGNQVALVPAPLDLGFRQTPTLLIVNASGVISDVFVGMALAADEQRILQRIRGDGPPLNRTHMPREINDAASLQAALQANATLVDIREREAFRLEHHAGAVSIPAAELRVRGPIELSPMRPAVVDCSRIAPSGCISAANGLFQVGFEHVFASTVR